MLAQMFDTSLSFPKTGFSIWNNGNMYEIHALSSRQRFF